MKEAGEEIAVCRLSHPCSLSIRLVSAAPPETARCRRSPLHRRPSLQGRRGLFSGPWAACPAEAEGSRGGGGGKPRSPFPGNSAASPSGGERSPAFLGQDSPPPEERNTHAVAGLPPPPGHSPHQLGAVLHLSAGRRAAPARRRRPPAAEPRPREPAAGARRPCQAMAGPRPQPAPRHGGGRHCCPPLLPSRQSARPRRASPMLALNGEGTGRWHPRTGGGAPGFCGRRAAFCCPANGVRRAGFASVSPGCRGGHCRRRFEVHSRAPWETRHFGF